MSASLLPVELLDVCWPAPVRIRSFCTTRIGGVSETPFDTLNLSTAGGDCAQHVADNVDRLRNAAGLPHVPRWPRQVHGTRAIEVDKLGENTEADAVFTSTPATLCAVRTADCLPVLLCDRAATTVAAAHAGWRGLAAGVLETTVDAMPCRAQQMLAWLGPAIGPAVYEVGAEVRDAFIAHDALAGRAFSRSPPRQSPRPSTAAEPPRRWLADLYELARQRLRAAGVTEIYGGGLCTFSDDARFFSYRRDGITGRMACGIWLSEY